MKSVLLSFLVCMVMNIGGSQGAMPESTMSMVRRINKGGPLLGLVVPNSFEMGPLLQSPSFVQDTKVPYLDFAGLSTQLLLTLFEIKGVVHFGVAGNANSELQIGDVTIPLYWAHLGLWNWQRYGDGPNDELAFESFGDFTRKIGHLNFSDYCKVTYGNLLNGIWYQPEEIFPVKGVPEVRQHAIWVPVDKNYYRLSQKLEAMKLERCVNSTTCLKRNPKVVRVRNGCSANIFVDNAAYRQFLRSKFDVTPIDMETAAVALVCLQQQIPFIAIRALSDMAGGGSSQTNEASVFASLAAQNAVSVVAQFVSLLT